MRGMVGGLPRHRTRTALAVVCLVVGVVLSAILTARSGEGSASPAGRTPGDRSSVVVGGPPAPAGGSPTPAVDTFAINATNPDVYAAAISARVLGMDTRTSTAASTRERLRAEADPGLGDSGLADLYATIDARVPTDALWERMRGNEQWSQWEPTRAWEPATWAQVVTGGHAEPGWVMRNVTGIHTTHYVEDGMTRSTARESTLSVVMRCPADGVDLPSCRLVLIAAQPVL